MPPDLAVVTACLPHDGPARLLTRVVSLAGGEIVCEGRVEESSPYARSGRCPSWLGLELAAQAAALLEATEAGGPSRPASRRVGYLVRLRGIECSRPSFVTARPLAVRVRRSSAAPPLFVYAVAVSDDAGELVRGQISIYLDPEPPAAHTAPKQNH